MGECLEYPAGSDEAAQFVEMCESYLGGTLGTGCSNGSVSSSSSVNPASSDGSVYDSIANTLTDLRNGQVYRTTTIDVPAEGYSEVWMAENLNYATANSYCYNDTTISCDRYGRLYTWAAAMAKSEDSCGYGSTCGLSGTVRGVCPKGWHVPSMAEWEALVVAVDENITEYSDDNVAGKSLKSTSGWNDGGDGTDAFSFSALPAGGRVDVGYYSFEGYSAYFWSSTEGDSYDAYDMWLGSLSDVAALSVNNKYKGFSVRCLKD